MPDFLSTSLPAGLHRAPDIAAAQASHDRAPNQDQSHHHQQHPHAHNEAQSIDEDTATLSTLSVIRFIENVLEEKLKIGTQKIFTPQPARHKSINLSPANQNSTRLAARAYAHAAKTGQSMWQHQEMTRTPDLNDIYGLLRRLRRAYAMDVHSLNAPQNQSFYSSISTALERAGY